MANEPKNAEEQLKRYAEERRQHVPGEIHPATRNILQGEVRRTYGSPEQERRGRVRLRWLQALAWLAIVAAIPLFLMPRNPARKNPEQAVPSTANEVTLPAANAPGEAPIELSDTKEPVAPPVVAAPTAAPVAALEPTVATGGASRDEAKDRQMMTRAPRAEVERSLGRESKKAEAAVLTAATASLEVAGISANNTRLNFANTIPNQQILNQFQFEQTGQRLKISEKDGSVYSGRYLSQQNGNETFQAAGINRTLNKATIITGQVVRPNLANPTQQQAPATSNTQQVYSNNAANNSLLNNNNTYTDNNVRVQGAAIVGNTQYKVDAQATPGQ
jgi:hypothetical protein